MSWIITDEIVEINTILKYLNYDSIPVLLIAISEHNHLGQGHEWVQVGISINLFYNFEFFQLLAKKCFLSKRLVKKVFLLGIEVSKMFLFLFFLNIIFWYFHF